MPKNYDELTISKVFIDIVNGYSKSDDVFVKHLGTFDNYNIQLVKKEAYDSAVKKGLPIEKNKLEDLRKQKIWLDEDNRELVEYKSMVDGLGQSRKNLFLPSQIKLKETEIKEWELKYYTKLNYKSELLGLTAEKYADRKSSNFYICYSLYKDKELKLPYFENWKFNELDDEELNSTILSFNKAVDHLSIDNIKKTSISGTFQNLWSVNDNSYYFLGKNTAFLTYYQTNLISYLRYYSSILSELRDRIPENYMDDPEKIEQLYISSKNIDKIKNKHGDSKNLEFFGATAEDNSILGNAETESDKIDRLIQEGKDVSLMDLANKKI